MMLFDTQIAMMSYNDYYWEASEISVRSGYAVFGELIGSACFFWNFAKLYVYLIVKYDQNSFASAVEIKCDFHDASNSFSIKKYEVKSI